MGKLIVHSAALALVISFALSLLHYIGPSTNAPILDIVGSPSPTVTGDRLSPLALSSWTPPSPISGTWKVIVIPVAFTDVRNSTTIDSIIRVSVHPLTGYYVEVSYAKLTVISEATTTWYRLPQTMGFYGQDSSTETDVNARALMDDAIAAATSSVDYRAYDTALIVHAGRDQASSHEPSDIWSFATLGKRTLSTKQGVIRLGVVVVSESDPPGVFAHELGHNLGLADLYDFDGKKEFVGPWSPMDAGNWLEKGMRPSHFMAPEKMWLGWITPSQVVSVGLTQISNITLGRAEASSPLLAARIPVSATYYTVEYRTKALYDSALPIEGVIISLVNESIDTGRGPIRVQDARPGSANYPFDLWDAAFTAHTRFVDRVNEVAVKVLSLSSESAVLQVQRGFADLRVSLLEVKGSFLETSQITFRVRVDNIGITASNYADIELKIDDQIIQSRGLSTLASGASTVVELGPWTAVGGGHVARITVDASDNVVERDESNNTVIQGLSIQPVVIQVDTYTATSQRADVGSTQNLQIHARWRHNGSNAIGITLTVDNRSYATNSTGWVSILVTSSQVGKAIYPISSASFIGTPLQRELLIETPSIVWDRVKVVLSAPKNRINVGANATISYSAIHEFDGQSLDGEVILNDNTFTQQTVGRRVYEAGKIMDRRYGLTAFTTNKIEVIFDRVKVTLATKTSRIDVNKQAQLTVQAQYEFDAQPLNGVVVLNNTQLSQPFVGRRGYHVSSVVDNLYGLTAFASNEVSIAFDTIEITLALAENRMEVGTNASLTITAKYSLDGRTFQGKIILNEGTKRNSLGPVTYTVANITDSLYGLTTFSANKVEAIFDRILVKREVETGAPGRIMVTVTLRFEYDNRPADEVQVTFDEEPAKQTAPGKYEAILGTWSPLYQINVAIERPGFPPQIFKLSGYAWGNIATEALLALALVLLIPLIRSQRKAASE